MKLNSNGDIVWQKAYQYGPWYYSLEETHDLEGNPDGYVVMGKTFTSQGHDDIAVAKLDLDGNVVWQKAYGGPDSEGGSTLQQTADGGYVLVATSFSFTSVYDDVWVLKLNPDGSVAWEKDYGTTIIDVASSIRQTWDGFVVGGYFHMPYGPTRIWVLKLNVYGEISGCSLWRNTQAFVTNTSYTSSDANLVAQASSAVPTDTTVMPFDSTAQANVYCAVVQPTIGYSPMSFSFSATQGGSSPSNQSLSIWNAGDGSLSWSVNKDANWLNLSPTSGTDSGTVTVSVNITGLIAGTYNAIITITAPGATNSPVTIHVTLTVNPPLTLLSPNGGEVIPSGSTYNISWGAPPEVVKFDIGYSLDDGAPGTWKLIATNLTSYSYNWTVPAPDGNKNTCRVGVRGYNASGGVVGIDTSDNPFTIEVVKLTYPNGGETLISGNTYQITWQTNGTIRPVQSIKIYGSPNEGQSGTWRLLTTVSGNPGYFDWIVPIVGTPKDKCRIGVRLLDSMSIPIGQDISDGNFTVQPAP